MLGGNCGRRHALALGFVYAIDGREPMVMTQLVIRHMKDAGWGRIADVSLSSAQTGALIMICYSSSKGAVVTMIGSMAREFRPYGITVNNIPPGSVMGTMMSEAKRERFQVPTEALLQSIPVRRMGEPADIANACAWLCHEASGYGTGQTIGVNGGRAVS